METSVKTVIKIQATIQAPVEQVWQIWNSPEHIVRWAAASDDWHTTSAENDLHFGGHFKFRMEARDGSMGFDFGGIYDNVVLFKKIEYTIGDGRKVGITFTAKDSVTEIEEHFEAESTNPVEMQQAGWQAILNNFKAYAESNLH
ncbi:MAG: SRPBCC domain-containing protein [Bacteroidetes bacterium]|nr:SRPBCC domain-containing protein [Bacteroidota bacterium]